MREYWMDTDSFITPYRGPYRFQTAPQFWDFLRLQGEKGVIGSPELVLDKELIERKSPRDPNKKPDQLSVWAASLRGILFISPDGPTQICYQEVVDYVINSRRYDPKWIEKFLDGADPWVIAYAKAFSGKIVTFEKPEPKSSKPKIPDVAAYFHKECISVWDMAEKLGFTFAQS